MARYYGGGHWVDAAQVSNADINERLEVDGAIFREHPTPNAIMDAGHAGKIKLHFQPGSDFVRLKVYEGEVTVVCDWVFSLVFLHEDRVKDRLPSLVQWNPFTSNEKPRLSHELVREASYPGIRPTCYEEVASLLKTSGCSRLEPYWDWSVIGAIDTLRGTELVFPGDWVKLNPNTGTAVGVHTDDHGGVHA